MSFNRLGTLFHKFLVRTASPAFQPSFHASYNSSRAFPSMCLTKNIQLQKRLSRLITIQNGLPEGKNVSDNITGTSSSSTHLPRTLRSFRPPNDAMPYDVTICIEGTEKTKAQVFTAHKYVLGKFSERFREMWRSDVQHRSDGPEGILRFCNVEPHSFAIMLKYMYAGDTSDLTMENAMDLLLCANFFKAYKLIQICRDFIEISLAAGNACHVFQRARLMNEEIMAQLALSTICKLPDGAFASPEFLQLSTPDLKAILDRDDLHMPEPLIYQHVRSWALNRMCQPGADGKNLRDIIGDLRFSIRFSLFDKELLDSGPLKDGVITQQELEDPPSSAADPNHPVKSTPRVPAPAPFYISCQIGCDAFGDDNPDHLTDRVVIELRPDFAPQTSAYARKLLELAKRYTSDYRGNVRLVPYDGFFIDIKYSDTSLQPPASLAHETSILSRTVPGAVCFGWEGNHCLLELGRFKQGTGEPEYSIWLASEKPDGGAVFGRVVRGLELLQSAYSHFLAGDVAGGCFFYWTTNWCLHDSFPVKLRGKYYGMQVYDDDREDDPEDEPEPNETPSKENSTWRRLEQPRRIVKAD